MAKKIFLTIIYALFFTIALSTVCLAKSNNTTTMLGNEITKSINKTEKSMDDLVDDTDMDELGRDNMKSRESERSDSIDSTDSSKRTGEDDSRRAENRAVAGTTGDFEAGEVQTDGTTTGRNGMTRNAWIWIVMVVVALIIVAAVWYYAAQK